MTQQTKTLEELRAKVAAWQLVYGETLGTSNDVITDLLAALKQAQKANEWRDIESAPKDGTFILGHDGQRDAPAVIVWRKPEFRWKHLEYGSTEPAPEEIWIVEADEEFAFIPTHWQPLPPKPQSETEG